MISGKTRAPGLRTRLLTVTVAAAAAAILPLASGGAAVAAPEKPSSITKVTDVNPREVTLSVYSKSMDKKIDVSVLVPKDRKKAAPVLYLLQGANGGIMNSGWAGQTKFKEYFTDKQVYVVSFVGGQYSYYTDWQRDDRSLGRNKWATFITEELPPLIAKQFSTTGANAVAGISMAGTSVFNLALKAPKLYRSIAAFSGCARTSDPLGQQYIKYVVEQRGKGNVTNMWGPLNGPGWRENDPYINAAKLRGTKIYITSGTGVPGKHDEIDYIHDLSDVAFWSDRYVAGGFIEAVTNQCTHQMVDRLHELKIPVTVNFRPRGTHSWGYWEDDLHTTWPKIERDLQ